MARTQPLAASTAVESALIGPIRPVTVIASTGEAAYLRVQDDAGTIICLATPHAVRVPCAAIWVSTAASAGGPRLPVLEPDEHGTVGDSSLSIGSTTFRVTRWWRPSRARSLRAAPPVTVAAAVHWLTG